MVRQAVKLKYDVLLEAQAKLDFAAAELLQTEQQLIAAETNFKLGRIAQSTLNRQKAALEARQAAWQNAALTLELEIVDYRAIINGLS